MHVLKNSKLLQSVWGVILIIVFGISFISSRHYTPLLLFLGSMVYTIWMLVLLERQHRVDDHLFEFFVKERVGIISTMKVLDLYPDGTALSVNIEGETFYGKPNQKNDFIDSRKLGMGVVLVTVRYNGQNSYFVVEPNRKNWIVTEWGYLV